MACSRLHPWLSVPLLLALTWATVALAQPGAEGIEFELGFAGEVVAGAWNPLRVLVRDRPGASLEVWIDQGSLRQGIIPLIYRAEIGGGIGLTVFEDDIFVPAWRRLTWALSVDGATVASGSLAAVRRLDERPLNLLLSTRPGAWRELYGADARLAEVAPLGLPERAASYDGVATLLIDGSAVAPRLGAVAAAAAAGVEVLAVSELPPSHTDIALLAPAGTSRLGEGWIYRGDPFAAAAARAAADRVRSGALVELLAVTEPARGPEPMPQLYVLAAAASYCLLVLVLIRLAGTPGLLAGIGLAAVLSVAAWRTLRPPEPLERIAYSLDLGGGDLAHRVAVEHLFSLPEGQIELESVFRPYRARTLSVGPAGTTLTLTRWQAETLIARPKVVPATLVWDGAELINSGTQAISTLIVRGLGPQPSLPPGGRLVPTAGEERSLSPTLEAILAAVPVGTAVAQIGRHFTLALPDPVAVAMGAGR